MTSIAATSSPQRSMFASLRRLQNVDYQNSNNKTQFERITKLIYYNQYIRIYNILGISATRETAL